MILLLAALFFNACEPVTKDIAMGGVLDAKDLKVRAENSGGGNKVTLINETPGITGQWDFMVGTAVGDKVEVVMPFMGKIPVKFTAFCDGGTVSSETSVNITKIDAPVDELWGFFAGTDAKGKEWTWGDAGNNGGTVWGGGGFGYSMVPNWGGVAIGATRNERLVDSKGVMTFDLNGGANITITDAEGTRKGTYSFDRKKARTGYSIGQLTIHGGAHILCGYDYYNGKELASQTFDIVKLTDKEMVLNYAKPDAVFQDPAWATTSTMWMFVAK